MTLRFRGALVYSVVVEVKMKSQGAIRAQRGECIQGQYTGNYS